MKDMRLDHKVIFQTIEPGAKILDLGCGDGELMALLAREKNAKVQGIELNEKSIYKCVEKGLSVFHSDIDSGLLEYPDKSFDYVVLNQSLQEARKVEFVLKEALRVGKKVIIGFPNFAYYKSRFQMFFLGKAPVTDNLPYSWYNSPNIHFFSIKDFKDFCRKKEIRIIKEFFINKDRMMNFLPNVLAIIGIFVISDK